MSIAKVDFGKNKKLKNHTYMYDVNINKLYQWRSLRTADGKL